MVPGNEHFEVDSISHDVGPHFGLRDFTAPLHLLCVPYGNINSIAIVAFLVQS